MKSINSNFRSSRNWFSSRGVCQIHHGQNIFRIGVNFIIFTLCLVYILCINDNTSLGTFSRYETTVKDGVVYIIEEVPDDDDELKNYGVPLITSPSSPAGAPPTLSSPASFYDEFLRPSAHCRKLVNIGGFGCTRRFEGNKDVCLDPSVAPHGNSCLVYSFGVADDITFEDSFLNYLQCEVHLFDPHVRLIGWYNEPSRKGRHFHTEGLSDHHQSRYFSMLGANATMKPLDAILREYSGSAEAVVHYLKLDIEGDEWKVLRHLVDRGLLRNVIQLAMEVHSLDLKETPRDQWLDILQERLDILSSIEAAGFRRVRVSNNQHHLCKVDFSDPTDGGGESNNSSGSLSLNYNGSSHIYNSSSPSSSHMEPRRHRVTATPAEKDKGLESSDSGMSGSVSRKDPRNPRPDSSANSRVTVNLEYKGHEEIDYPDDSDYIEITEEERKDQEKYRFVCQEVLYVRTVDTLPSLFKLK